jgi:mannonate dehydratase
LFWLEDTVPAEMQEGFRIVRQHTVTALAVGEVFNTIWDTKTLIEEQLIDYIRATVVHAGGVTHLRRIADFASIYQIRTGFHGAMDMSPICLGACLHLDLALPNFGIQEYSGYTDETLEVFPRAWTLADGYLHPGHAVGHGVDIDEELARKFPYQRAYLPVNRLEDGTLWHW